MTFNVCIVCDGVPRASYSLDFLPRIGDTIISDTEIPYVVTEVAYYVPKSGQDSIEVVVYAKWR